ncbi:MAG: PIN domain-containing protein [Candidatus Njordarchaeum guaymaensis]
MLKDIPINSRIFIDFNIFIYHFLNVSESCTNFTKRDRGLHIQIVLAETLHRLMIAELIEKYDIKPNKAVQYLKEKPEVVPTLEKCETAVKKIPRFNVKILSVPIDAIFQSKELRKKYYLLTNDSLNLHVMKSNKISDIATNDRDFERVDFIKVWRP